MVTLPYENCRGCRYYCTNCTNNDRYCELKGITPTGQEGKCKKFLLSAHEGDIKRAVKEKKHFQDLKDNLIL